MTWKSSPKFIHSRNTFFLNKISDTHIQVLHPLISSFRHFNRIVVYTIKSQKYWLKHLWLAHYNVKVQHVL